MAVRVFPEDLLNVVVSDDARRREKLKLPPHRFRPWQRFWIETAPNAVGLMIGIVWKNLPLSRRRRLDIGLAEFLGRRPMADSPLARQRVSELADLARSLTAEGKRSPGLLLLTSHPPAEGPLAWLRFEMVGLALDVGYAFAQRSAAGGRAVAPEGLLAIDPYALESVPAFVGALYSGLLHQIGLAWDRQPSTQSWWQRHFLLRGTGRGNMGWRLLKKLRSGTPVVMALAGGVPATSRLLYTIREWVQRLPVRRWPLPRLEAEKRAMESVAGEVGGFQPALSGFLPVEARESLTALLTSLGLSGEDTSLALRQLTEEFRRTVPFRERFWRVLIRRMARSGQDLLALAITHRDEPPHLYLQAPWAFRSLSPKEVEIRLPGDPPRRLSIVDAAREFSRAFE